MTWPIPCLTCGATFPSLRRLRGHERSTLHVRDAEALLSVMTEVMPSGCWEYRGKISADGYGSFGKTFAHRASYELRVGLIPAAMQVCHACDNPPCVNPAHLWVGTNAANADDSTIKGRRAKGTGHGMSKLTDRDVLNIRASSESLSSLARRYGVAKGTIVFVRGRHTWTHL